MLSQYIFAARVEELGRTQNVQISQSSCVCRAKPCSVVAMQNCIGGAQANHSRGKIWRESELTPLSGCILTLREAAKRCCNSTDDLFLGIQLVAYLKNGARDCNLLPKSLLPARECCILVKHASLCVGEYM